jgi:uncharacterized metal-binding protein YceD (DUF177 family)
MRFRLHKLLSGPVGKTQREVLDFGLTRFDDDLTVAYLRGSMTFTRLNESVLVNGHVDTATTVQCVRSLENFELCLSLDLTDVIFGLPDTPTDEPDRQVTDDGWLDLTETLREEIVMAIPINPISPRYSVTDSGVLPDGLDDTDREWLTVRWHMQGREEE